MFKSKRPIREECPACRGTGDGPPFSFKCISGIRADGVCDACHGDRWVYTTRPCALTIRWHERRPPQVGHFVGGQGPRVRTAYRIVEVKRRATADRRRGYNFTLMCRRYKPGDVPPKAPGYWFRWDKRASKRA